MHKAILRYDEMSSSFEEQKRGFLNEVAIAQEKAVEAERARLGLLTEVATARDKAIEAENAQKIQEEKLGAVELERDEFK